MVLRASALIAALLGVLALPAAASAHKPRLCLTGDYSFLTPKQGVPHDFDASCTTDADGQDIVLFEWDLDGDGVYERSGASPTITHTYTSRAAFFDAGVTFTVRATDAAGETAVGSLWLDIIDDINSWFSYAPELVNPGDPIELEASADPWDPDTTHYEYAWDLDGDGTYEHETGPLGKTTMVAPDTLGLRPIGLRITDDTIVSTVRRQVEVLPRHPSRDQIPWNVPPALDTTAALPGAPASPGTTPLPVGPDAPAFEPTDPAPRTTVRRPRLKRIDADKRGLLLVYTNGPKWSRYRFVVKLPADRAASYGLPRRTVVFARGYLNFNGRGVGRTRMRWTKGAYDVFLRVRWSRVDIIGRRIKP